jgi:hypothetical protein
MNAAEERALEKRIAEADQRRKWKADLDASHEDKKSWSHTEGQRSRDAGEKPFCGTDGGTARTKDAGGMFMKIQIQEGSAR